MTAICPAGPPKVCSEMANQVRTAVRKEMTGAAGSIGCIRSVWLVIGSPGSGRLTAEQCAAPVVLVEGIEHRAGHGEGLLVGTGHGEAAEQDVQAGRLGGVEAVVVEVGDVHDLGDPPQHG